MPFQQTGNRQIVPAVIRSRRRQFRLFYSDDFHSWMIDNRDLLRKTIARRS